MLCLHPFAFPSVGQMRGPVKMMAQPASESCGSGTLEIYVLKDLQSSFTSHFERTKPSEFSAAFLTFSVHSFCANNSSYSVQSACRTPSSQQSHARDFPGCLPLCSFLCAVTAEKRLCGKLKMIFSVKKGTNCVGMKKRRQCDCVQI